MSISNRDIQATALLCIRQHGESAAYYAAGRADEMLDAGAIEGAKAWRRVLAEIERLQAMEPERGPQSLTRQAEFRDD